MKTIIVIMVLLLPVTAWAQEPRCNWTTLDWGDGRFRIFNTPKECGDFLSRAKGYPVDEWKSQIRLLRIYVETLEERIETLEKQIKEIKAAQPASEANGGKGD